METFPSSGYLVEAEAFDDFGGWVLDSQFDLEMGSPYLLAHGNGRPVADATTIISTADKGDYNIWVRTKDWVPGHHPGKFTLAINGTPLKAEFGADNKDWHWQSGGRVHLAGGKATLTLHDLTGFCGRCDAIFFSRDNTAPPERVNEATRAWRRKFRGIPDEPTPVGPFDVVVVGGGMPGACAALTAARLGDRVALIQDRPVLGGNGSVEIGLRPRGVNGPLVEEIKERHPNGDLVAKSLLDAEPNATLFLEHVVYDAVTSGSTIVSVDAREARSGRQIRVSAPVFIDCSGRAVFGQYAGAETLFGLESKAEYGEGYAPEQRVDMHHGNTVFFRTRMADSPVSFPSVPWATEVAKDFAELSGQLVTPSNENGDGPRVFPKDYGSDPKVAQIMERPNTHYWEYGQWLDPYTNGEHIRDYLLRAIYGSFSNVKTMEPEKYANLEFDHMAFVAAQGEFKRYKGDYVLSENDVRAHKAFPDAVVPNGGAFCLHYPGDRYSFRLANWTYDLRDEEDYVIPFRCLYSCNVSNLMMAGKHLSVTHVAGSSTKFMGNGGQHAIATAAAAHLCKKYNTNPRAVGQNHMAELQTIAGGVTGVDYYKPSSRL